MRRASALLIKLTLTTEARVRILLFLMNFTLAFAHADNLSGKAAEERYWHLKDKGADYTSLAAGVPIEFNRIKDGKIETCLKLRSGIQSLGNEACILIGYECSVGLTVEGLTDERYECVRTEEVQNKVDQMLIDFGWAP
jgi:hypothetical protein